MTHWHQRVVELLDAVPEGDVAVPVVDPVPLVLPVAPPDKVALPDVVPPVPVAPIELVPLVEPGVVVVSVLAVPLPLMDDEPVVELGDVEAVDELVEGVLPGVVLFVVDDVVLDSRFVHAPSDRAATTASAAAAAWVRVIFIRNSLNGSMGPMGPRGRAAATALPRL